jgi:hypothetical protein
MAGAPSKTRTCDLQVRNLALYPTELWARDLGSRRRGTLADAERSASRLRNASVFEQAPLPKCLDAARARSKRNAQRAGVFAGERSQRGIPPRASLPRVARGWSRGGEGGIRTLGTVSGTRDFQSRAFSRSATSPRASLYMGLATPPPRPPPPLRQRCVSSARSGLDAEAPVRQSRGKQAKRAASRSLRRRAESTRLARSTRLDVGENASFAALTDAKARFARFGGEGGIRTLDRVSPMQI